MISISTCWNSARHTDGANMLRELMELGFDTMELGHGIRISLMQGVERMAGRVRFSSLHNFCPLPVEMFSASPDCLEFSSYKEAERERAVRLTCQTIDWAVRLDAPIVILHCGRVAMPSVTERLVEMAENGGHLSPEYARLKLRAVQRRERAAAKHIVRLKDCLARIVEYAAERNVRLGLESRQNYEEIPSEREFDDLLAAYPTQTVGYWHDFGHIQTKENLGFVDHACWLAHVAPRLIGCHLHDVIWPDHDHRTPWVGGTVDYAALMPLVPKETPLVWEISPKQSGPDIAKSLQLWKECFVE